MVVGYGFTGLTGVEDFVKNRLFNLVMIALMLPLVVQLQPSLATAWARLLGPAHRSR